MIHLSFLYSETASANTSPSHQSRPPTEHYRRRSEGSDPSPCTAPPSSIRRNSFHASPMLRCRYSRCGKVASATSSDGLAFKNCHNCSYTYCSRACRRAHWEKHRKTCLFSRVGTLCRQVLSAAKEQQDTLLHLSIIARRGYLAHGRGAVKCFFACPEAAEIFLLNGLEALGEPTYICWPDLLPSEMGPQMYSELVKMCKSYNPESKFILYVSVCVVSEAPAAGAVKWERQLVSRCAKMRLSKSINISSEKESDNPETLILTCPPIKEDVNRFREIIFCNIQKHLRQRGISLRRHYPDIYKQLCAYAENTIEKFNPVTVYPRDSVTGKNFICIIMPDTEPENVELVMTAGVRISTIDVLQD